MSRIVLITAGNRGLGRAAALALADDEVDVALTYRSGADGAQTVVDELTSKGRTAAALQLDTTKNETFAAFAEALQTLVRDRFHRDTIDMLLNTPVSTDRPILARLTPSCRTSSTPSKSGVRF